jgi:hypothetical protein
MSRDRTAEIAEFMHELASSLIVKSASAKEIPCEVNKRAYHRFPLATDDELCRARSIVLEIFTAEAAYRKGAKNE